MYSLWLLLCTTAESSRCHRAADGLQSWKYLLSGSLQKSAAPPMSGTAQPVFKSEIQKHYLPPGGTDHPGLGNTDGRPGPVPSKKLTDRGEMVSQQSPEFQHGSCFSG